MDQTFNLISKTGSLKLKLNNDLNRNSDARIIDTRTSRRLPLCTPLLIFQWSLKSSFARTWNEKSSVYRYFTSGWYFDLLNLSFSFIASANFCSQISYFLKLRKSRKWLCKAAEKTIFVRRQRCVWALRDLWWLITKSFSRK